jgi:hypothetical protein
MKPSSQTSLLLLSSVFRRDWSSQRSISFRVGRKPVACFISQGEVWLEVNGESGRMVKGQLYIWTSGSEIRVTYRSGELQGYVLFLQHVSLAKRRNEWGLSPDSEFISFLHASGRLPSEDALRLREVQLADLHLQSTAVCFLIRGAALVGFLIVARFDFVCGRFFSESALIRP